MHEHDNTVVCMVLRLWQETVDKLADARTVVREAAENPLVPLVVALRV